MSPPIGPLRSASGVDKNWCQLKVGNLRSCQNGSSFQARDPAPRKTAPHLCCVGFVSKTLAKNKSSIKLPTKELLMFKTLELGLKNNNLRPTTCSSVALNRQKHFLSKSISKSNQTPTPNHPKNSAEWTLLINYYTELVARRPRSPPRNIFNDLKNLKLEGKMKYGCRSQDKKLNNHRHVG